MVAVIIAVVCVECWVTNLPLKIHRRIDSHGSALITHSPQTKKDRNLWFILLSKTKEVHESSIILIKIGPQTPEKIPQIGKNGVGNSSIFCEEQMHL